MAGLSQLEAHVNGNCMGPMTCSYCSSEPPDPCEVCDGQGEVYNTSTQHVERCHTCLGTGIEQ